MRTSTLVRQRVQRADPLGEWRPAGNDHGKPIVAVLGDDHIGPNCTCRPLNFASSFDQISHREDALAHDGPSIFRSDTMVGDLLDHWFQPTPTPNSMRGSLPTKSSAAEREVVLIRATLRSAAVSVPRHHVPGVAARRPPSTGSTVPVT